MEYRKDIVTILVVLAVMVVGCSVGNASEISYEYIENVEPEDRIEWLPIVSIEGLDLIGGIYIHPDNPETVKVQLITSDGQKWRAEWVKADE